MTAASLTPQQIDKLVEDFRRRLEFAASRPAGEPSADQLRAHFVDLIERAAQLGLNSLALANVANAILKCIGHALLMEMFAEEMRDIVRTVLQNELILQQAMKEAALPTCKAAS